MKRRNNGELDVSAMDNDVWSTALCALALHELGEPLDSPTLAPAIEYLLSCQCDEPMPKENQRRIGAKRTGGWPFQRGNESMPDTDDTGVVLAVLATLAGERSRRALFQAIDDGVAWVLDMQNDDGGFPTFVWGLPSKKPGPMFDRELPIGLDDPAELVRSFFEPAPEYGDPALEGVTGRVLWGLGAAGLGRDHPAVSRAIEFLREQQLPDGAWWGRWKACYLAETATIVLGLSSVGEDPTAPWVQRALDWIVAHQNDDGGFGESADAYVDERLAGCGPSSPAVTAYVLLGLLGAGRGRTAAAAGAARWLLCNRSDDGLWSNAGWLHTFIPPELLYTYPIPAQALPIVALARWARAQR